MAMIPRAPQLDVHIEALVLDGVAPGDPRVAQAVERATRQALAAQPRAGSYAKADAIANAVGTAVTQRAPRGTAVTQRAPRGAAVTQRAPRGAAGEDGG